MPRSLADWLAFIETQHAKAIDLGLERASKVLARLDAPLACPVITVGGTNGKGSACAMLASILRASGRRVGLYTSPHLLRFNERIRVAGEESRDAALAEAFAAVEAARGATPLTYFEFGTLAAIWLFARSSLEAAVLEVGLGGRLDAVNAIDPDCAVLTGIGIDHVDYLGASREAIGREKAGIFRAGRPAVVSEPDPPESVLSASGEKLFIGKDFGYQFNERQWSYWGPHGKRAGLAHPALRGRVQLRNAAAALCALDTLRDRLPVTMQDVRRGLAETELAGRFQVLPGRPQVVLDVAHNPQAARELAGNLAGSGYAPETIGVCGMLRDKDARGVLQVLAPRITRWHFATLAGARGASARELAAQLESLDARAPAIEHACPAQAFAAARDEAGPDDKIVVFGSFLTVGEVMAQLQGERGGRAKHG